MKPVMKWVVRIIGALGGAFLILLGVLFRAGAGMYSRGSPASMFDNPA